MNIIEDIKQEKKCIQKREDDEAHQRRASINEWMEQAKVSSQFMSLGIRACFIENARNVKPDETLYVEPVISTAVNHSGVCTFSSPSTVYVYYAITGSLYKDMTKEKMYAECQCKLAEFIKEDFEKQGQNVEMIHKSSSYRQLKIL